MTLSVNLHDVNTMTAARSGQHAWLKLSDGKGQSVTVFMDYSMASEISDLWEAMNREPEPPTFDEDLATKCAADARTDEARVLKGMRR